MLRHTDNGLSENPLQVWWLYLHAGTATLATWLLGYMSAIHVQRNWPSGLRRSSGLLFVTAFSLLVLTGYLIYYVSYDRPLMLISNIHWIIGLCAPAGFLLHRGLRRRRGLLPVAVQSPGHLPAAPGLAAQPAMPEQSALAVPSALPSAAPLAQQLSAAEPRIGHSPAH